MKKLTHPLGKTIKHNTQGPPSGKAPSSVPGADKALTTLKTTTKLARVAGQAASSDTGGPANTGTI